MNEKEKRQEERERKREKKERERERESQEEMNRERKRERCVGEATGCVLTLFWLAAVSTATGLTLLSSRR